MSTRPAPGAEGAGEAGPAPGRGGGGIRGPPNRRLGRSQGLYTDPPRASAWRMWSTSTAGGVRALRPLVDGIT
jgi:hypothetical protein